MQKLLLNVFALFLMMFSFAGTASASFYRIDIDNASNVTLDINDNVVSDVHDGMNNIDMGGERYLRVTANPGILFTEVTMVDEYYNEENDLMYQVQTMSDGRSYIDISSSFPEDEYFRIRTSSASDARSASFTLSIDDPTKAKVIRKEIELELNAGENTVKFDPATESKIEIVPVDRPLYSVLHNGNPVTGTYRYDINVADGDNVEIISAYPDVDYAVKFNLTGNGAEDFITEVDVNSRPEFNWKAEGFSVKAGSQISFKGNTNEFEVISFTVNGATEIFTNPTRLFITEDTEIDIEVRKYNSFEMTINIDDPTRVNIFRGYSYNGDRINLKPGDNKVEITRNTPIVSLVPVEGCYIVSLDISNYSYDVEDLQRAPVMVGSLTDNDVLTVTTDVIVRDKNAVVFVHNLEAAADYFKVRRADQSVVEVKEGYNGIAFYDRDNSFRFETGAPVAATVYVNDELAEPAPGGFTYTPDLADGDIVKVYFDFVPSFHNVTFDFLPEIADAFAVTCDRSHQITASDFKALTHTEVSIAATSDNAPITVSVDGDAVAPDSAGNYTFVVDADKTVTVSLDTTGIEDLEMENAADKTIYNLQGIRMNASFGDLPAGLYIIGNKIYKR